ncbi:MAG: efflux RND transporter periplasmic adaptor subunit, partial [Rubripirellula sp.]
RFALELRRVDPMRLSRGLAMTLALMAVGYVGMFHCSFPTAIRVPAVVHYHPASIVRSRASGFVHTVHVKDGARVRKDDVLAELVNPELSSQIKQLELLNKQNAQEITVAIGEHDPSREYVLRKSQFAVKERLNNLRSQASGLQITSPRDGIVVGRNLDALVGTYLHEGETILMIGGRESREVIALVGQSVIDEVRSYVNESVTIRTAAFHSTCGRLVRVEPRAGDELLHPSLAATEGGVLAVREDTEDDEPMKIRLLEPHFQARIGIDSHAEISLPAGMRAEVSIGRRTDTLAIRTREAMATLWHAARNSAAKR